MTWSDVVAIAPSLAAANSAQQAGILVSVDAQCVGVKWGAALDAAQVQLAAHLGTMILAGAVFADRLSVANSLGGTVYGIAYKALWAALPSRPTIAIEG